jgi:hypothetical protein
LSRRRRRHILPTTPLKIQPCAYCVQDLPKTTTFLQALMTTSSTVTSKAPPTFVQTICIVAGIEAIDAIYISI